MFTEEFIKLSSSDQNTFASVCNKLLLKGFIVRDIFDPKEKIMRVNPDYRFLERYFDIFVFFFADFFNKFKFVKTVGNNAVNAVFNRHTDFFFRNFFFLCVRVDTEKAKNAVCRNGKKPYYRSEYYWKKTQHSGHAESELLCFFHCESLRNEFAENKREIWKYKR